MDLKIGQLQFTPPPAPAKRSAEVPADADFSAVFRREDVADIGGVPAVPPEDVLREVDRAAARAEELWRQKRELHFAMDDRSGRVIVQVRDLDGHVIRTIPPSEAVDIMSGRPL